MRLRSQPPTAGTRPAALVGLVALALTLGGCLSIETPAVPSPTPPPPSDTPTFVFPTLPPTATLTPSPSDTPTPDLIAGLGPILFADSFDQDKGWQLGEDASGASSLLAGRLVIAVRVPRALRVSLSPLASMQDFFVQTTARADICGTDDSYGLAFRANNSQEFYRFGLDCSGRISFVRSFRGTAMTLLPPTASPAILPGPLVDNQLAVIGQGNSFTLFVNGLPAASVRDGLLVEGGVGVFVQSGASAQTTVSFADFTVRSLLPTVTPTRRP